MEQYCRNLLNSNILMDPHLILLQIISSPYKNGGAELSVFQRINGSLSEVDAQVCCVFDAAPVARLHGRH